MMARDGLKASERLISNEVLERDGNNGDSSDVPDGTMFNRLDDDGVDEVEEMRVRYPIYIDNLLR